jgi:hypothetical protein
VGGREAELGESGVGDARDRVSSSVIAEPATMLTGS